MDGDYHTGRPSVRMYFYPKSVIRPPTWGLVVFLRFSKPFRPAVGILAAALSRRSPLRLRQRRQPICTAAERKSLWTLMPDLGKGEPACGQRSARRQADLRPHEGRPVPADRPQPAGRQKSRNPADNRPARSGRRLCHRIPAPMPAGEARGPRPRQYQSPKEYLPMNS